MPISDKYPIYYAIKKGKIKPALIGPTSPVEVRFWARVDMDGPIVYEHLGKCWMWTGYKDEWGYGRLTINKSTVRAHRYSWELNNGPITDSLLVLHKCDNPECTNPNHLFLGTDADNIKDRDNKKRGKWATGESHGSKTHPESVPTGERNGAYTHPEMIRKGEEHGRAILTEEDVLEIRAIHRKGSKKFGAYALARKYGMSPGAIQKIISGQNWKHLL